MINRNWDWQPAYNAALYGQPGNVIVAYDEFMCAALRDAFSQVYCASNEWSVDNVFN